MESIQSTTSVLARASEYAQAAKRERELEQQAAAKTDNASNEQPANRVTFSQAAQTRLNEEKTHLANQVAEVRNAERAAAAEVRGKAMLQERNAAAEQRAEAAKLREEKDSDARLKAEAANDAAANKRRIAEATAGTVKKIKAESSARAIEQQKSVAKDLITQDKTEDLNRTIQAQTKETADFLEKQKAAVVVKNRDEYAKDNQVAVEHLSKLKSITEHTKVETAKAMRMYQHIDSMGRSTSS